MKIKNFSDTVVYISRRAKPSNSCMLYIFTFQFFLAFLFISNVLLSNHSNIYISWILTEIKIWQKKNQIFTTSAVPISTLVSWVMISRSAGAPIQNNQSLFSIILQLGHCIIPLMLNSQPMHAAKNKAKLLLQPKIHTHTHTHT